MTDNRKGEHRLSDAMKSEGRGTRDHDAHAQRTASFFTIPFLVLTITLAPAVATGNTIFVETFDNGNLPGGDPKVQFQTGLSVTSFGDVVGWTESNLGAPGAAVHSVDLIAGPGTDFAVTFYSGVQSLGNKDIITLTNGIAANEAGVLYALDFEVSPAVHADGTQSTTINDSLLIEILRADDSVLASYNSFPGVWAGAMAFVADGFTYAGDGSGPVRIRISSANPGNNKFAGAIDNLELCEVPDIEVDIDINPGSDPNSVNLRSRGKIPVAVLTTEDFLASLIADETVLLADPEALIASGGAPVASVKVKEEDVDNDGDVDLLFFFSTQELVSNGAIDEESTFAVLTGQLFDGTPIFGSDAVRIVPKR